MYRLALGDSGNDEYQTHIRISQHIAKRVDAAISEPVRDCEGLVVDNLDEASGISLGRNIDRSIGASRCDKYERSMSNEPSTMVIDGVDNLCRAEGMSNDGADFAFTR